ncbi:MULTISPECIES: thioredoxin fold domain-containing protein [Chryseobacterium]|uniref:Thioredoxin-related protein n=1 Tax=Chryseobacterium geocarposphaerae TaxID=1416776 RepID=A0ABU1LAQ4_9FLAO|nr:MULTISPECIES: thioredoxin fold domain-containing protein [Chryseobacterium]MDR6403799.1 thioredoxin-related protein [Chryseobacterium geocarposphaerae]MDR6698682.1 thioredoxin-related protein [Chryseobacterium ginsenosidimutans]
MKKIISGLFIFSAIITFAQEAIHFQDLPFKDLIAKAKKENKIVFIDAYTSWCGPCKMMEKNIFTKKSVGDYYNSNFVNARFDMEKGEGREIAAKYGVRSYPTYLFLNGDGELVSQNFGYMEESLFISMAQDINSPNNKKGSLKERFANGEKDPEFLINIMKLNSSSDFNFAKNASERYFENKKKTEEFSKDDVGLLLYFLKSTEDKNYKTFAERKTEIIKFLPEQTYKEFDNQLKLAKVVEQSIDQQNKKINDEYFMKIAEPLVGKHDAEVKLNQTKLSYYEQNANFPEYEKAALAYYKNSEAFEPNELLKAAWVFSEHVKTPASLKKAAEWAEKSVMRGETSENTYILAKLYFLTGNKEMAKTYAEMSKNIATQTQKDSTLADELLKQIK